MQLEVFCKIGELHLIWIVAPITPQIRLQILKFSQRGVQIRDQHLKLALHYDF